MTSSQIIEGTGVSLAATVDDDDALYRVAQALLALASAPGRRSLRLWQPGAQWEAFGLTATTTEFAPPTLSLDAGLSHRAHLHAMLLAPLAVEVPQFTTRPQTVTTFAVQREGLPVLFTDVRSLAAALDAQEEARQGSVFTRRSRQAQAAHQLSVALQAMRGAAVQVVLTRLQ